MSPNTMSPDRSPEYHEQFVAQSITEIEHHPIEDSILTAEDQATLAGLEGMQVNSVDDLMKENIVRFGETVRLHTPRGEFVFKPAEAEQNVPSLPTPVGSYYRRERLSFLLDRYFGFHATPVTSIAKVGGKEGAIIRFIPNTRTLRSLRPEEMRAIPIDQLGRHVLLDYLLADADSNMGNHLLDSNGDFIKIDHGHAFNFKLGLTHLYFLGCHSRGGGNPVCFK